MTCTTHHYACECRERALNERIKELGAENAQLWARLKCAIEREITDGHNATCLHCAALKCTCGHDERLRNLRGE